MRLQKDRIIKTALEVLDRDGLEGVTLRRLAKELGVQAPAIYWHIASKEVLLDEMANAILQERFGDFDFANDQRDWAEWLNTLAHELRAAMLAHREGGRVVAGAHLGIAVLLLKLSDLSIRVLQRAGFSGSVLATLTITVTNFTFGFVIEEQSSPPLSEPPDPSEEDIQRWAVSPSMRQVMEEWMDESYDVHFDTSIRIIINGARIELAAQNPTTD